MATIPTIEVPRLEDPQNGRTSTLRQTPDGMEGTRYAIVKAVDPAEAIAVPGLPSIGRAWSADLPGAIVQDVSAEWFGGEDVSGQARWLVTIRYGSAKFGGVTQTKYRKVGDAITEFQNGSEQQTVYSPRWISGTIQRVKVDETGEEIPLGTIPNTAVNNGDGAQIVVSRHYARVSVWYDPNRPPELSRLIGLGRPSKLNDAAVTLPPMDESRVRWNFAAGQVRYDGYTIAEEATGRPGADGVPETLLKITHQLELAENHGFVWQGRDANGDPTANYYRDDVYASASFTGLWPET